MRSTASPSRLRPASNCSPPARPNHRAVRAAAPRSPPSLARYERPVVIDAGSSPVGAALDVAASAAVSLLVMRPCFLALRRAVAAPVRPSGVVLVREPGRSLGRRDVEEALQVPVCAEVDLEPAVARAVDAGLLAARLPRSLAHALRHAA